MKPKTFADHVEEALKHFGQPQQLGESPLAQPYWLGEQVVQQSSSNTTAERGRLLQHVLLTTALLLEASGDPRLLLAMPLSEKQAALAAGSEDQRLLYYTFFHPAALTMEGVLDAAQLSIGRATYYKYRKRLLEQFVQLLVRWITPAIRPELPPLVPPLVDRAAVLARCQQALAQKQTVALSGPSGIGKTAVAATLAKAANVEQTFWYTVRPGFNDQLGSFGLAFGAFVQRLHGQSLLLSQLIADRGNTKHELLLNLLRYEVAKLPTQALICCDQLELLRPVEIPAHAELIALLASLRGLVSLVLVGQTILVEADLHLELTPLGDAAIRQVWAEADLALSEPEQAALLHHTQGNPRLLRLLLTLQTMGEPLALLLNAQPQLAPLEALTQRLWTYLALEEQQTLLILAVLQGPVPETTWPPVITQKLLRHGLLYADRQNTVSMIPAFQPVVLRQVPATAHVLLHLEAGILRQSYGQWTAAMQHYVQADQHQLAAWLWLEHREQEIDQGQAAVALPILQQINDQLLAPNDRTELELARNQVLQLLGDYGGAQLSLTKIRPATDLLAALVQRAAGNLADLRSDAEAAITAYRAGLTTIERLAAETAQFHKQVGWSYLRQGDAQNAWQSALRARYEAVHLQADIRAETGEYAAAASYYHEALDLAIEVKYLEGQAKTSDHLAQLLAQQGNFAEAEHYWATAQRLYQQIGRLNRIAGLKTNQAMMANLAERPAAAVEPGLEAFKLFEQLGDRRGYAVAAQNLAETYYALGDYAQAARFAECVIGTEDRQALPDGLRVLAETRLAQGEPGEALDLIQQAISLAEQNNDLYIQGYCLRSLAQIEWARQQPTVAQAALDQAVVLFGQLDLASEVAKTNLLQAAYNKPSQT